MSYILDALKKSEQERGHGSIPGVQTVHSSSLNYHHEKRPLWPWFLIAVFIINLVAIIYFVQLKEIKDPIVAIQTETVSESPIHTGIQEESVISVAVDKTPTTNTAAFTQPERPIPGQATAFKAQTTEQIKPAETTSETVDLYDLPLSVRQHIPAMKFSAHVYSSNPLQRSLVINNRFLEEGSQVNNELMLTEITSDGAVFDFQGYRFSTSVISGWD